MNADPNDEMDTMHSDPQQNGGSRFGHLESRPSRIILATKHRLFNVELGFGRKPGLHSTLDGWNPRPPKREMDRAADADDALCPDPPAVRRHDSAGDVKAQARASRVRLSRMPIPLEDAWQFFRRYARASVGHCEPNKVVCPLRRDVRRDVDAAT